MCFLFEGLQCIGWQRKAIQCLVVGSPSSCWGKQRFLSRVDQKNWRSNLRKSKQIKGIENCIPVSESLKCYISFGVHMHNHFLLLLLVFIWNCHFLVVHLYLKVDAHTLVEGRCFSSDCLKVIWRKSWCQQFGQLPRDED